MSEAQPVAEGGITSEQQAARAAIANNTTDTTEFGTDTALFRQIVRDQMNETDIELNGMSLTKIPDLGGELGFQSIILEGLTELRGTTQTHTRDLLITEPDELFTTLNVGDVAYLSVDQEEAQTMMQINFVGPITERIELVGMDFPDPELSLTSPRIMVMGMLIEKLKIGPGCRSLIVVKMKNLKTIEIEEPGAIEVVRFKDLPALEHYTDLPETANREGNVFDPPVSAVNRDLLDAVSSGDLEGVRAALAAGADPNAREGDVYRNTAIGLATRSDANLEIARTLLEAGADPSLTNFGGVTAWEMAEEFETDEIANLLRPITVPRPRNLLPAFSDLPVLPLTPIPEITLPFANQQVYDFEENEEVPMITLLSKMGHIIFKAKESYFTLPIDQLEKSRTDGSQIRYKCHGELHGAPVEGQVDLGNPYYYIQGNGNFIVPLHELTSALTKYKIIELEQTDIVLDYIASAKVVMLSPTNPVNQYGEDVNIVSADHCQDGTKQRVFKLSGIVLTAGGVGGASDVGGASVGGKKKPAAKQTAKRHVSPKRTVSKKRGTYKKKRNYQGPYINPTYNLTPFKR